MQGAKQFEMLKLNFNDTWQINNMFMFYFLYGLDRDYRQTIENRSFLTFISNLFTWSAFALFWAAQIKEHNFATEWKVFILNTPLTPISVIINPSKKRDANNHLKFVRILIKSYALKIQTLNIISPPIKSTPFQSLCAIKLNKLFRQKLWIF